MKKILLGTTTLIGAAGLFAGAALADTPKVTVGGYENFEMGYMSDDERGVDGTHTTALGNGAHERGDAFRSDTQVDFKIDGKSDAGLGYGGEVDLLADTSADVQGRGVNASKTFIYMDGTQWGRVELGSNVGADGTMKVDAGTIARATGGIDGDWSYFANSSAQYLAMSSLPLAYGTVTAGDGSGNELGNHTEENLNKVTYYTPRFAGFQVGVSFLPDQVNRGQGANAIGVASPANPGPNLTNNNAGQSQNIWTGGVNYDTKFGDVGLALAGTGEYGTSELSTYDNLEAWNGGGKLSYMGWSIAGSYGSWGKSDRLKADNASNTHYWDAGVAYEYGPFGASLTYLNSTFACGKDTSEVTSDNFCGDSAGKAIVGNNKFSNWSGGVDYKLAPGLTPYAEISRYDENAVGSVNDNKGYVGIVGTQLNF